MKNTFKVLTFGFSVFMISLLSASINAQTEQAPVEDELEFSPVEEPSLVQTNEQGIAIDGYDPVAYFDQGKAVQGEASYNCEYLGRQWYFSSSENRDKFLADPEKFAPQYGGYCAYSLGNNKLVRSNPESFAIKDGQLHLYVNDRIAKKDQKKDTIKFSFDKKTRDKNWFTYQREF